MNVRRATPAWVLIVSLASFGCSKGRPAERPAAPGPLTAPVVTDAGAAPGSATADRARRGRTQRLGLDEMASGAAFLGWTLGDELDLGAGDFVAIEPGVYRFVDAVRVGEQTAERVLFHAPGGRLDQVELVFAAEGEAAARALAEWVDAACAPFTDQVERFMPSPLGTPPPGGGEWDPVHTSKATCAGAIAGVRIAVREQQTWTKETHSSDVRVTLRAQTDE